MKNTYGISVFINCPFDDLFKPIFHAMVYSIIDCGFIARCSLEESNAASIRIDKISRIISESQYGIHDISRTELCQINNLPRFNMPLELGLFLGAKRYGDTKQNNKICLITDREPFRYNKYISDINGQDISCHNDREEDAINAVTKWLRTNIKNKKSVPGGIAVNARYTIFKNELPSICQNMNLEVSELGFNEYVQSATTWIKMNPV